MSKPVFGFNKQLVIGEIGELVFLAANSDTMVKLDGRHGDFQTTDGQKVELKTDTYPMARTANFFFERWSNAEKRSPGGPYQALEHGAATFAYFFVRDLTYFTFPTEKLVGALEEIIPTLEPFEVHNSGYVTIGYRVPREAVMHLAEKFTITAKARKE